MIESINNWVVQNLEEFLDGRVKLAHLKILTSTLLPMIESIY